MDKAIKRGDLVYLNFDPIGEFDFYKVISVDNKRMTQINTFNMHGTLNKPGKHKPKDTAPIVPLPTRIVSLDFKPNSTNTVELYMDGGWQFSFRIHNAAIRFCTKKPMKKNIMRFVL